VRFFAEVGFPPSLIRKYWYFVWTGWIFAEIWFVTFDETGSAANKREQILLNNDKNYRKTVRQKVLKSIFVISIHQLY